MLAVNYRERRVLGLVFEGVSWQGLVFALTKLPEPPPPTRPAVGTHPHPQPRALPSTDMNHLVLGAAPAQCCK